MAEQRAVDTASPVLPLSPSGSEGGGAASRMSSTSSAPPPLTAAETAAPHYEMVPPENLALVSPGILRSAFPKKRNFKYLQKIRLKSVLTLVPESMPDNVLEFYEKNGITLYQFGVPGNKEPFVDIPEDKIALALATLLDRKTHPILVHCNKGKHRTGCLIGCLRKIQHWSHISICEEYRRFAHPKARALDQQFIELFDVSRVRYDPNSKPEWL